METKNQTKKQVLIITASPNKDGLTAACGNMALEGCSEGGVDAMVVSLNDLDVGMCMACDRGWGPCRNEHYCKKEDDFQELHRNVGNVDALILITPVYWWEMSESMKTFIDRLRRCEAFNTTDSTLKGKPIINVAAAGGTGNGCIPCLYQMEKFTDQVKAVKFDFIHVIQRNKGYKLQAIKASAGLLAQELAAETGRTE